MHHRLRARRGARLTALTSGGAIPETGDYASCSSRRRAIGTVNEDFAVESLAGDIFQLGNASYRILRIEPGRVRVEDAQGAAPNIPFWLGEAPGRSDELSIGVSRLRGEIETTLERSGVAAAVDCAGRDDRPRRRRRAPGRRVPRRARSAALGALPTRERVVIERFFDESGGMQLVIHAPFGSRINRAWGLALRKRFCRRFNFELQAAATEDAIVLSLSTSHSFPLDEVARYLHSATALDVLVQALLDAPMFGVRWRWNATISLALPRFAAARRSRRSCSACVRGPAGRGLPRPGRVRREPGRRARDPRPSAGRADPARLPGRGDGRRGLAALLRGSKPARSRWWRATCRRRRRSPPRR